MNKDSLFTEFSKQSPKGILIIYAKILYRVFKATWILIILFIQRFSKLSESAIYANVIGCIALLIFFLIRAYLLYKNFRFKIENDHFILKEGILKKKNTSVSFDRIQHINFKQNLIQQLINVYEVSIETAGSKETEIAIRALSYDKAQALKMALSQTAIAPIKVQEPSQPKPLLKIGFLELLKVSITENHLQNLLLFIALVIGALQQLKELFDGLGKEDVIGGYSKINPEELFNSFLIFIVIILVLVVIGVLSSFVRIVLFHFNLTMYIKNKAFDITQGLLTKKSVILSKEKVQSITISTNPIKQKLGISYITFKQAVSGKVKKQQHKLIRIIGCKEPQLQTVKELLYAKENVEEASKFSPHKYYLLRMCFQSVLVIALLNTILFVTLDSLVWLWVNLLVIPLTLILAQLKFKKAFYQFNEELLLVGKGRIETHLSYLPFFKVQNIKMKQTYFQEKRNVVNLVLQTASGKITIPCIEKERAKLLYNYILFKVESNKESWM